MYVHNKDVTSHQDYPGPSSAFLEEELRVLARYLGMLHTSLERLLEVIAPLKEHNIETYAHCLRVGIYAARLANREGLDVKLALQGGCSHDLGKCAIENETLRAQDFTDEHITQMKDHPHVGATLLAQTHLFSSFIAGLHHQFQREPYVPSLDDLLSFPLSAATRESVLAVAQLVAFCDFYDALTTRENDKGLIKSTSDHAAIEKVLHANFDNSERISWILSEDLSRT